MPGLLTTADPGIMAVCNLGHFSTNYKLDWNGSYSEPRCATIGCCLEAQLISTDIAQALYDRGRASMHTQMEEFVASCKLAVEEE